MKVEQKITIELEDGKKLELEGDEAKQLYNKLHELYGKTVDYPYVPYVPFPIYPEYGYTDSAKPDWEIQWPYITCSNSSILSGDASSIFGDKITE